MIETCKKANNRNLNLGSICFRQQVQQEEAALILTEKNYKLGCLTSFAGSQRQNEAMKNHRNFCHSPTPRHDVLSFINVAVATGAFCTLIVPPFPTTFAVVGTACRRGGT